MIYLYIFRLERTQVHLKNSEARVNILEEDLRMKGNDLGREIQKHEHTKERVEVSDEPNNC